MEYWEECIYEALEDAGIKATKDQIGTVAAWVEGAHENYSMAHGYDAIPNPLKIENEKLKAEIKAEQSKVFCEECKGTGRIVRHGVYHSADSECTRCRGEGRHV